jgi:ribokinase
MRAVSAALRKKGVENVIITLGGNGSAVAGAVGVFYMPSVKIPDVKGPTAAGDSFVAAFCTAVTAGLPETQALAFTSHTAALTVSRMGAMPFLPTMEEVQSLLRKVRRIQFGGAGRPPVRPSGCGAAPAVKRENK